MKKTKEIKVTPKEQEIVDQIAKAMVDRFFEDQALGIHHKPVKRKT